MKLLRINVIEADTCGGLLDGLNLRFRTDDCKYDKFDPLCLVGPNGSGKSQLLQVIAEVFQTLSHWLLPKQERTDANAGLQFEVEYLIRDGPTGAPTHVKAYRKGQPGRKRPALGIEKKVGGQWVGCDPHVPSTIGLLPAKVIGYTSGDNETLSLPFFISRTGYAAEVSENAIYDHRSAEIPDNRMMLIDYGTNLEVLVANQLLSDRNTREALLKESNVNDIDSCRCIIQLAHRAAPPGPRKVSEKTGRKGIQLTDELEQYLDRLRRCSTCYAVDNATETYTFDFFINEETRKAFRAFWNSAQELYVALHKLAMLNVLAIRRPSRLRFVRDVERRFATRLPEPPEEDKVFRFEQVRLRSIRNRCAVDYVSLSDGEHQMTQILGTLAMQSEPGTLFLLDEPESHFNPQWRVKFITRIMELPTRDGRRGGRSRANRVDEQECLITTHSPFLPSDMPRERIFVFRKTEGSNKIAVDHPATQTYGASFDSIVESCFGVQPPISDKSRKELERLLESEDVDKIASAVKRFGDSVEKAFLIERMQNLSKKSRSNTGRKKVYAKQKDATKSPRGR